MLVTGLLDLLNCSLLRYYWTHDGCPLRCVVSVQTAAMGPRASGTGLTGSLWLCAVCRLVSMAVLCLSVFRVCWLVSSTVLCLSVSRVYWLVSMAVLQFSVCLCRECADWSVRWFYVCLCLECADWSVWQFYVCIYTVCRLVSTVCRLVSTAVLCLYLHCVPTGQDGSAVSVCV